MTHAIDDGGAEADAGWQTLKPCPFCGEAGASLTVDPDTESVVCDGCTATGPSVLKHEHEDEDAMTVAAIGTWNDRQHAIDENATLRARVERLEAALRDVRALCADRERFVLLGPRGFATALALCEGALEEKPGLHRDKEPPL